MNTLIDSCIITRQVPSSYSKEGLFIPQDRRRLRLHLNIFSPQISKFDIKCYTLKPEKIETLYVGKPLEVYLDINDCSSRLHLSKEKILQNLANLNSNWWIKKLKKTRLLIKIIDQYQSIICRYQEGFNTDFLIAKDYDTPIQKKTLMKIISVFHEKIEGLQLPCSIFLKFNQKTIAKYALNNFSTILAAATFEGNFWLINKTDPGEAILGGFGVICKLQNISLGRFAISKEAITDFTDYKDPLKLKAKAIESIKTEIASLRMVEQFGRAGFQKAPYFTYDLGFVGYYYNKGDLGECAGNLILRDRLPLLKDGFRLLIYTMKFLHDNHYVILDVKPENIFVETENDKKYDLCYADLAGLLQSNSQNDLFEIDMHTHSYSPFKPDHKLRYTLKTCQAFDVFQLGATFYATLTNNPPYNDPNNRDGYPVFNLGFDESFLKMVCSKKFIYLLKAMCNPIEDERFTIKQVVDFIDDPSFTWTL